MVLSFLRRPNVKGNYDRETDCPECGDDIRKFLSLPIEERDGKLYSFMKRLDDILVELRHLQPELQKRYPIREMGVFGSWVRGEQREDSDLDVLVDLGDGITLIQFLGLQYELSDRLGIEVDLVMADALRPRIGKRILAEAVML
jgi:predicted nucleotidyltransferase